MTPQAYYAETVVPALSMLLAGTLLLFAARRRSAQVRQFICGATLASLVVIAVVPMLPARAKPVLPPTVARALPLPPRVVVPFTEPTATPHISTPVSAPSRLDLLPILALIGTGFTLLLALRLAGSLSAVDRLRKRSRPASSQIRDFAEENVRVVESLSSPVALGGFKPVILLPAEAEQWPEDRIRAVLIHEQAHLRNGDPNWQVLAEVACLLHWFNPLVWVIRGAMRREAERAADDAVLRAGVKATDYASELVAFAAKMGADRQPVAWTAFARRNGVKDRVRAILSPQLSRSPMTKKMKFTAVAGVALATYTVSAYAFQERSAFPQSPYADVREGKTTAASPKNGFVGTLADGRKVEVVQVSRRMPSGEILAWRPDGTALPESERIPYGYKHPLSRLNTHTRYIFVRFPSTGKLDEVNAGFGSSSVHSLTPSTMTFAGGGNLRTENGIMTTIGFVGLDAEDSDVIPVSFGLSDNVWADHGAIKAGNGDLASSSVELAKLPDADHREALKSFLEKHPGPLTKLTFVYKAGEDLRTDLRVAAIDRQGNEVPESESYGNFGYYQNVAGGRNLVQIRYFAGAPTRYKEFRLQTRTSFNMEVLGLAANPKKP